MISDYHDIDHADFQHQQHGMILNIFTICRLMIPYPMSASHFRLIVVTCEKIDVAVRK